MKCDPFGGTASTQMPVPCASGPSEVAATKPAPFPSNEILWTSSIDGPLSNGAEFIHLTATDSDNHYSYAEITIYVGPFC